MPTASPPTRSIRSPALVDFSRTAADYAAYRPPFPSRLFSRLRDLGVGLEGEHILDVGAGTGLLGCELARRGCQVILSDVSPPLLARARARDDGREPHLVAARAESLPFADQTLDGVTAAQCWHWLDRQAAPLEIGRILRPGAWLAVIYQMYLPLPGSIAEASERLILKFNPRWRHANSVGINGQVLRDMQWAGFINIESFTFDVEHAHTHDAWRGVIRTCSAVGASLTPVQVDAFDREHAGLLADQPPLLQIPHRVFAAIARKPRPGL